MKLDDKAIIVPACTDRGHPLVLEMELIYRTEARLVELSFVSKEKAGELLYCFIDAWSTSSRYVGVVHEHWVRAKQNLKQTRAGILLDEVPDELRRRNLVNGKSVAGSEDLREAVVCRNESYNEAFDRLAQIEAALKFLEMKAETFKMAYFSVNKLLDNTTKSNHLSGGAGDDDVGKMTAEEELKQRYEQPPDSGYGGSFGKVKY